MNLIRKFYLTILCFLLITYEVKFAGGFLFFMFLTDEYLGCIIVLSILHFAIISPSVIAIVNNYLYCSFFDFFILEDTCNTMSYNEEF